MTLLELLNDLRHTAAYFDYKPDMQRIIAACDYCDFPGALAATQIALTSPSVQRMEHLNAALGAWLTRAHSRMDRRLVA